MTIVSTSLVQGAFLNSQLANIPFRGAVYVNRSAAANVSATPVRGEAARNMSQRAHIRAGISSFFPFQHTAGVGDLEAWITQGCPRIKNGETSKAQEHVAPEIRRNADQRSLAAHGITLGPHTRTSRHSC